MKGVLLCKDCAQFIHHGEKCARAFYPPDYVTGKPPANFTAQTERESPLPNHCGPNATFFVPMAIARSA